MLKIWGRTNSTNVKKVLWCAEELGIPYQQINAGGQFGIVNDASYRAMNPNGLVPCLQDGDLILWESHTIVRYLAAKHHAENLYPTDLARRASAEKWMDWVAASVMESFRLLFWNTVRLAPEQRDPEAARQGMQASSQLLAVADAQLARQPYLSGDDLGVGDIPLGCVAYAWFEMPIQRPDLPHLQAWYDKLKSRPAYQKAVMVPLT